ncbi:unannotated protein [freshwater metagenome]|uniref:Unannotated protein n=1 Tax=freshwater metagenome TaxID=449393 RepID=A0A6J7EJQ3_9ZZZZ
MLALLDCVDADGAFVSVGLAGLTVSTVQL